MLPNPISAKVLTLANMINNGKRFIVVSTPDYNGGHYYKAESSDYELGSFEYVEWEGSPFKAAKELPTFLAHIEPIHDSPEDYEMTMLDILKNKFSPLM